MTPRSDHDHDGIRTAVRAFATKQLAPGYLDRAKSTEFPWKLHREIAALGIYGLLAGDPYNPLEREDFVAAGIAIEELAYADFNVANIAIPVLLMSSLIRQHGSDALIEQWLGRLVSGETFVAFGLTEPDTGSDAANIKTTARATTDGYVLNGEKTSVTMLGNAEAIIVAARTIRDGADLGVSAFLVPLDSPGIAKSVVPDTGWGILGRGVLHLDDVEIPAADMIGAEGRAFSRVLNGFDFTRPLLALTGIGTAQAALDETAQYVRRRTAFGTELAKFEGVSFPIAEHLTKLEAARLICYSALEKRTLGLPHTAEAAMAKWYGPLVASAAVKECLLLHGNYGYSQELPFEQRLRDVMSVEIADGTAQIQKIIIMREKYGTDFVPYEKRRKS
ncbi:acyl-CoA dehydrogenase family protein [Nocardia australiensis]|uniref:acyl-CoA dehydrogenase family protein n=1 Tax=Nocardia australiensis TaxID=2887191 RepID=UPI001D1344EE|nr:acyl-CoA dehydrogenase family protein [Nocardia australiensis]